MRQPEGAIDAGAVTTAPLLAPPMSVTSRAQKEVGNRGRTINYSKLRTRGGDEQGKQSSFCSKEHLSCLDRSGETSENTVYKVLCCV